jgi:Uncharacterised conserved protein
MKHAACVMMSTSLAAKKRKTVAHMDGVELCQPSLLAPNVPEYCASHTSLVGAYRSAQLDLHAGAACACQSAQLHQHGADGSATLNTQVLLAYVNLLKTISMKLTPNLVELFFHADDGAGEGASFPLYTEAVKFVSHRC